MVDIVPKESRHAYDIKEVIIEIVDNGLFYEIQEDYAANIVIGLARVNGETIGIVANQPKVLGGVLDCDSSVKAARFIRFCNAFDIPILTLVDVPGFMPGSKQENNGIIRHGAKLLYAYSEANVFKMTVVLRKAYGGAYIAMGSRGLGADIIYAWSYAEISVMGAESAISVLYGAEIKTVKLENRESFLREKVEEYQSKFMNSSLALEEEFIDELIEPDETREKIIYALLNAKRRITNTWPQKNNGNIPL